MYRSVTARGIHWDELDEDISVDGLIAGLSDITQRAHHAA
ncbi:MAG: DUF2442 domain-containing protein [Candidatus Symbiopectobacterium sp. Dall1.0]|nr:DUF2442 domain-containing protein [Candidatus Symbiopectobacterium sp. Dall1.0]